MRILLILLTLITYTLSFSQIEIQLNQITVDSVAVLFPEDMQIDIGKEYEFVYKTHIRESDSLKESWGRQYVYDGLRVTQTFDHYERGLHITSKSKIKPTRSDYLGHNMFYINGTEKWKLKIDRRYRSRYIPNDLTPNSVIEIEIQSDNYDLSKAKYQGPIVLYWLHNKEAFLTYEFTGDKVSIDLAKFPHFLDRLNKNEKNNAIVILLPQVKVKRTKLFSDEQKLRMYIMRYVE